MRVDQGELIAQLKELYLSNPGSIANIAWHKLESFLQESETYAVTEKDAASLFAIRQNQLICYWSNQAERFLVPPEQLQTLDFLVLHEHFYRLIAGSLSGFAVDASYPLFYDHAFSQPPITNRHYCIDGFNFTDERDFVAAAKIITETETGYTVTPERVQNWTGDKAFAPDLWLLARDKQSGRPVGVGISCYYAPAREADLDWFFVAKEYQGRGIGRLLIAETIARCRGKSEIIRLSGIADGFYQKCGFRRGDRWYLARRKPGRSARLK